MNGKSFLVDLTRCIACRGCQIACKQWKKLPAEKTTNWGSYQNPQDLSFDTIRLVRFSEMMDGDKLRWLFFPEQCRHCLDAPCSTAVEKPGAILHDKDTGAVVYTEKTAQEDGESIRAACPYDIPRMNAKTKVVTKCDMCYDRVVAGKLPACVQACPTGTMNFGDRDDILKLAEERLAEVKQKFPDAMLVDPDSTRVIFLAGVAPENYYKFLEADASDVMPDKMSRKTLLAKLGAPIRNMRS